MILSPWQIVGLITVAIALMGGLYWFAFDPLVQQARSSSDRVRRLSGAGLATVMTALGLNTAVQISEVVTGRNLPLLPTIIFLILAVTCWAYLTRPQGK